MDNMAYLQQIAGNNNSLAAKPMKGDSPLAKIFNIWTLLIGGGVLVIFIIILVVVAAISKVDTKDQDLMKQSYFRAYYLLEETLGEYSGSVKSSDIRNMSASLKSVLNEIMLNELNLLLSEYEIEVDSLDEEEDAIMADEHNEVGKLNETLETARLSGTLDRVYVREMAMQIAYLRAYQSEIVERTKNDAIQQFSMKAETNLDNLYTQFHEFNI